MITSIKKVILVSSCFVLAACQNIENIRPDDPSFAPVIVPSKAKPQPIAGSLFVAGHNLSLFGNTNQHRVGDIITIVLDERTVSTKSSTVEVDKETSISLLENGNNTILGRSTTRNLPLLGNITIPTSAEQSREFEGDASADQSNSLEGNISVTITDIMPNGNLVIRGEKWLKLNRGDEYIRISGMLRPSDVGLDNMVPSTRLANARIAYSGTGELADSQRQGWLGRFFNGPYWPL